MEIQSRFSRIRQMNQWRGEAQRLLYEDTRYPEGWSLSTVDPARALAAFPCLSLAAGWKLVAFQYFSGRGHSITLAVPEEADEEQIGKWLAVLREAGHNPLLYQANGLFLIPEAKPYFMQVIIGDGSPDSFAQASLLMREIGLIGGFGHGAGWSESSIFQSQWMEEHEIPQWELVKGCRLPADSTPLVVIEENVAHCRFYIESAGYRRTISLCEDVFFGSSMHPESVSSVIATSEEGGYLS